MLNISYLGACYKLYLIVSAVLKIYCGYVVGILSSGAWFEIR